MNKKFLSMLFAAIFAVCGIEIPAAEKISAKAVNDFFEGFVIMPEADNFTLRHRKTKSFDKDGAWKAAESKWDSCKVVKISADGELSMVEVRFYDEDGDRDHKVFYFYLKQEKGKWLIDVVEYKSPNDIYVFNFKKNKYEKQSDD